MSGNIFKTSRKLNNNKVKGARLKQISLSFTFYNRTAAQLDRRVILKTEHITMHTGSMIINSQLTLLFKREQRGLITY